MLAMTRTGMCWAYSSAASTTSLPSQLVDQLLGSTPRVDGSSLAMAWGEKIGSSMRRASWWYGGSEEIGGAMPAGASSTAAGTRSRRRCAT